MKINKHALISIFLMPIIKENKSKHAYIKLQISPNFSPPFCQLINKGAQNKLQRNFLIFVKSNNKVIYMRYTFMKKRDVKLTPPAYMRYMKKELLDPDHIKHNIQCISGNVKLLLHTCIT